MVFFFGIKYLWGIYNLPSSQDLIEIFKIYFTQYGIIIFFFTAFFETLFLVGNYFPGTLILLFGLSTLIDNFSVVLLSYFYVCLGMMCGYTINYFLGKYGWCKVIGKLGYKQELEKIEEKLKNTGLSAVLFLYILPGFGSLLSSAFGILKFSFVKFFLFMSVMVFFWNGIWALTIYLFGEWVFNLFSGGYLAILLVAVYLLFLYRTGKISEYVKQA